MSAIGDALEPATAPEPKQLLSPDQILLGPRIDPLDLVRIMSADEFEDFIQEWAFFFLQRLSKQYELVARLGGAGDLGRDVVCYVSQPRPDAICDVFQCKHYDHALYPGDLWPELGKLCYHTHSRAIPIPRKFRFVAPRNVGPEASRLLADPEALRCGLINAWSSITGKIAKGKSIPLHGSLLESVRAFPFTIVGYKPIHEVIAEHEQTARHAPRFGGGLKAPPPPDPTPPAAIQLHESRYVQQLVAAYGDHFNDASFALASLDGHDEIKAHFARSRERFYCAEALREFARDTLPENAPFEDVQEQVYDAVVDVAEDEHASGYRRVLATTHAAAYLSVTNHPLKSYLKSKSLQGICHQLANINRLIWVRR